MIQAAFVTDPAALIRQALKSQYHASLAMLKSAIEQCPDDLWADQKYTNPFWRIVYHTLYFAHFYSRKSMHDFTPWEHHQTFLQDLDDIPAPPEFQVLGELPHRPPQTGVPYTKAQMLEYWAICDTMIDESVDALDILSPDSGFSWYPISKLEHQIVAVRHTQHHTAQLADRIRNTANEGVDWVGRRRDGK
ncbi:MAG: DinB family protein [Candidatus Zixiibacteriota bacterium]